MSIYGHIFTAAASWTAMFIIRVVLAVLGLPLVALGLNYIRSDDSVKTGRAILNMPRWLWLWGNDADGLLGDNRGWWDDNADKEVFFGLLPLLRKVIPGIPVLDATHPLAMWWWAAIRNPVNNLRYVSWFNCVPSEHDIELLGGQEFVADKPGQGGWQFVVAKTKRGRDLRPNSYGFYFVHEWNETSAFVIRLGHKIEPRHVGTEEPKGLVFKINPVKSI